MLASFYPKGKDQDYHSCRTDGCSCCSVDLDIETEKDRIINEIRDNIRIAKKVCKFYKVDFNKLAKHIRQEEECKEHKFFFFKYQDQEVCEYCGFWKPKELNNGGQHSSHT